MTCGCNKIQGGGGKRYKHKHTRSCSLRQSGGMFEWLTGPVKKNPNTSQAQSQPQSNQSAYPPTQSAYPTAQPEYIGGRRGRKTRRAKKSRKNKKSRRYRR